MPLDNSVPQWLNIQSGLFNLGLVALHRSLVVQNDTLHLYAHGPTLGRRPTYCRYRYPRHLNPL